MCVVPERNQITGSHFPIVTVKQMRNGYCTQLGMLVQALPITMLGTFDQFNCKQLLNLFMTILPRSTLEVVNEAFDRTMITVNAGKAYRLAAERQTTTNN